MDEFVKLSDEDKLMYIQDQLNYWFELRTIIKTKMSALTNEEKVAVQGKMELLAQPTIQTKE